jgi:hypothetical protein
MDWADEHYFAVITCGQFGQAKAKEFLKPQKERRDRQARRPFVPM